MKETTELYDKVREFMIGIPSQEVYDTPTEPSKDTRKLRAKLIIEEAMELIHRGLGVEVQVDTEGAECVSITQDSDKFSYTINGLYDPVETLDGSADLSVVNTGTLVSCGLKDVGPLQLVCGNNIKKLANGTVNEDGKLVKSPNHEPPNLSLEYWRQVDVSKEDYMRGRFELYARKLSLDLGRSTQKNGYRLESVERLYQLFKAGYNEAFSNPADEDLKNAGGTGFEHGPQGPKNVPPKGDKGPQGERIQLGQKNSPPHP